MATISPVIKFQFLDENGDPLALGTVTTYAAGTTTPKVTYTTEAGTTTNANPIVLDASGRADIFLTDGEAYKFILKDALATTEWTVDNITAAGSMMYQDAAAVAITGGTIAGVTITGSVFSGTATNVTGVVAIANGGTGEATAPLALAALGAAASGANTDITSLASTTTISSTRIGYLNIPSNPQTAAYIVHDWDAGECIDITTGGVSIPANGTLALEVGFTFSVFNNSGSSQTISITTDTLRLAGTTSTGSRTLAPYGWATARKVETTLWVIAGAGLT